MNNENINITRSIEIWTDFSDYIRNVQLIEDIVLYVEGGDQVLDDDLMLSNRNKLLVDLFIKIPNNAGEITKKEKEKLIDIIKEDMKASNQTMGQQNDKALDIEVVSSDFIEDALGNS
jgi:hydroxymethylpyrimidine/phosphomethylpyrimidine kinase